VQTAAMGQIPRSTESILVTYVFQFNVVNKDEYYALILTIVYRCAD